MATLIYDGECPFCTRYAEFMAARERYPGLSLLDARENRDHLLVKRALDAGLVIDQGMIFERDGELLYGAEALAALAGKGNPLGSTRFAEKAYPWLRGGRNLALRLLGRGKMGY